MPQRRTTATAAARKEPGAVRQPKPSSAMTIPKALDAQPRVVNGPAGILGWYVAGDDPPVLTVAASPPGFLLRREAKR